MTIMTRNNYLKIIIRVLMSLLFVALAKSAFAIEYSATVSVTSKGKSCPHHYTFKGFISSNHAGKVQYRWLRSDGANSVVKTINFRGAGSQPVTKIWKLGRAGENIRGWMQLEIVYPQNIKSNKAEFSLACPLKSVELVDRPATATLSTPAATPKPTVMPTAGSSCSTLGSKIKSTKDQMERIRRDRSKPLPIRTRELIILQKELNDYEQQSTRQHCQSATGQPAPASIDVGDKPATGVVLNPPVSNNCPALKLEIDQLTLKINRIRNDQSRPLALRVRDSLPLQNELNSKTRQFQRLSCKDNSIDPGNKPVTGVTLNPPSSKPAIQASGALRNNATMNTSKPGLAGGGFVDTNKKFLPDLVIVSAQPDIQRYKIDVIIKNQGEVASPEVKINLSCNNLMYETARDVGESNCFNDNYGELKIGPSEMVPPIAPGKSIKHVISLARYAAHSKQYWYNGSYIFNIHINMKRTLQGSTRTVTFLPGPIQEHTYDNNDMVTTQKVTFFNPSPKIDYVLHRRNPCTIEGDSIEIHGENFGPNTRAWAYLSESRPLWRGWPNAGQLTYTPNEYRFWQPNRIIFSLAFENINKEALYNKLYDVIIHNPAADYYIKHKTRGEIRICKELARVR